MSTRVSRRCFLKQGALPLLATSLDLTRPTESNVLQQPRREGPIHTGGLEETPYPTEERTNRSDSSIRERVTYVCGRGEVENYFRSMPKPAGYEQNLEANCELRTQAPYAGIKEIEAYLSTHPQNPSDRSARQIAMQAHYVLGQIYSYSGNMEKAVPNFATAYELAVSAGLKDQAFALEEILGIVKFRRGQVDNWVKNHNPHSSIFPLRAEAQFQNVSAAESALKDFLRYLDHRPDNMEATWLLNLTSMALGKYPESVPKNHLLPLRAFESKDDIGRFVDGAPALGLNVFSMAGGVVMDDFDNDGYLDLVVSTGDHCEALHYFHNQGDGTFENRSAPVGLSKVLGGFNVFQADYNNDGWLDIYVTRGAWETPVRHSLLRNNGDGTFSDVTVDAGINIAPAVASQTAAWGDYDNDGWLDLFVGGEHAPSHLFHNNGDGTFTDVARQARVDRTAFTKGAVWGDYDNDGYLELYVSNEGEENFLYHYNGDGTFQEIARDLHVETPVWSFPVWFWDYDNDGWLDLYVSSHYESVSEVIKSYLRLPTPAETHALYRNLKGKAFQDVTREVGLDRVSMPMGANFGDVDNDGFLDFYLGTGAPSYGAFIPNMLFRNVQGKRFVDITASSGTGLLQKGHGIAIGNLFRDGQPAIFAQMGGMAPGDRYYCSLFKNPGSSNHWIDIKLRGAKTNRSAIGARIKLVVEGRDHERRNIFRDVTSGGSFGASPLEQHIGVGNAARIETLEIWWPTSKTRQTFHNLSLNQYIEVEEFRDHYTQQQTRPSRPPQ